MNENNEPRGRDKFYKYKRLIDIFVLIFSLLPKSFLRFLFQSIRNLKGIAGIGLRYILIKAIALEVGDNVSIHPGVYLLEVENLKLGNNISIHPMCYIDAMGGIEIKDDVSIAHGTTILSSTHNYESLSVPIKDQGIELSKTLIENDVWIGAKSTILSGITIEKGSIVAASAVVTKNVPSNSIVAGVPARVINTRE